MLHARHKRARRVDHFRSTSLQLALNLWCDAMCANHRDGVGVSFVGRVDCRDSASAEPFHLLRVVNQWSKRANRAHAFFDRLLDHFDGALDAKTESEFVSE